MGGSVVKAVAIALLLGAVVYAATRPAPSEARAYRVCVSGPENGYGVSDPGPTRALMKANYPCGRARVGFKRVTRAVHVGHCDQAANFCDTRLWHCFSRPSDKRGGWVRCRNTGRL